MTIAMILLSGLCNSSLYSQTKKDWVVVIDPGHGGKDPGAIGGDIKEKDITLAIALKLGKQLSLLENTRVIFTRQTDEAVELYKRAKIANENKADLFISIHCNSVESSKPYGAETWVMGLHKSKANLEVARAENAVILLEDDYQSKYDGFDPNSTEAEIIFSLYQNTYLEQSVEFASLVQKELRANAQRFDRGVKQAGFLVLYKTNMPGILAEAGFLSNENERKYLASDAGQLAIATSLHNAVVSYREKVESVKPKTRALTAADSLAIDPKVDKKTDINTTPGDPVSKTETDRKDKGNPKEQKKNIDPVPKENQATSIPETYFAVQILTSSKPKDLSDPVFNGVKDVHMYEMDGSYRYVAGYYSSVLAANNYKNELIRLSFTDSFVVAFHKGKRISVAEAESLLKK